MDIGILRIYSDILKSNSQITYTCALGIYQMAQGMVKFCVCVLLLLMVVVAAEGAAKKPKKVKCKDKKYPSCYHKNLYCPASCLRTCVVDCASCKPVCTAPPPPPPSPPPPPPKRRRSPPPASHLTPPSPPSTSTLYPPPPPSTSTTTPLPSPPPAPISTTPLPSPPPPTPISTTPIPSPPPPASPQPSSSGPKRVKCKNKYYTHCYGMELNCPSTCPDQCEVDCVTCSPVCSKFLHPPFTSLELYDILLFHFSMKARQRLCLTWLE